LITIRTGPNRFPGKSSPIDQGITTVGGEGYAFANVNAIPISTKEKRKVSFSF